MRTTVVLNDELVAEAKEVLGGSLRSMIEASLREAIQTRRREQLLQALETGELELTFTAEDLREWRRDRDFDAIARHTPLLVESHL